MLNNQQQIPQIQIPQKEIEQIPSQEPEKSKYEQIKEFMASCPFTVHILVSINLLILFCNLFFIGNGWIQLLLRILITLFAWAPIGKKIENSVGSGRYICLSFFNLYLLVSCI